jgi:hypothetical protein
MKNHTILRNKGFGPIAIIIIAAIILGGGAGTYKAVQKSKEKKAQMEANTEVTASSTDNASVMASSTTRLEVKNRGTLRALIAQNKNLICTVKSDATTGSAEGTVYLSGTDMRGDFVLKNSGSTVNSHMIKLGSTMYAWSDGGQGVKMDVTASANSNAGVKSATGLDESYSYECKDWSKDASQFVIPTTVTFIDVNAMINGQGGVKLPSTIQVQ